jgi:vesicle coat complex subunit
MCIYVYIYNTSIYNSSCQICSKTCTFLATSFSHLLITSCKNLPKCYNYILVTAIFLYDISSFSHLLSYNCSLHLCLSLHISVIYRVIRNDCRGFTHNNFSYTIHLRQQYVVAPMGQEILKFYDARCVVVMHY